MAESKTQGMRGKSSEVRCGPLDLVQKGTLKKAKTYYAMLSSTSRTGVARLELYEDIKHSLSLQPLLMLVGQDVIKVEMVSYKGKGNSFLVSTKDHHYTFLTRNSLECLAWVKSLQETLLRGTQEANPFRNSKAVTQDNDIYESGDEILPQNAEFIVKISEGTQDKIHMKGTVRLMVENGNITIRNLHGKKILQWTIPHIRRFGWQNNGIFFLEAGRKSTSGEGLFSFVTEQGESIMKAIKSTKPAMEKMDGPGHSLNPKPFHSVPPPSVAMVQPEAYQDSFIYEDFYIPSSVNINSKVVQEEVPVQVPPPTQTVDVPQHQKPEIRNQTQEPTYDDPVLIRDAWKSNGLDEDSEMYSTLAFTTSDSSKKEEEEEDHYWQGTIPSQPREPIYAAVDFSKKKNKIME